MPMLEGQWRLQYGTVDYSWGGRDVATDPTRRYVGRPRNRSAPTYTDTEIEAQDFPRAYGDGRGFGQDFRRGQTITFDLGFKGKGATNVAAELSSRLLLLDHARVWRGDGVRLVAGQMATLTTCSRGVELTTFGRPRRWAPDLSTIHAGDASVACTFDTMDDVWYGPEVAQRVNIVPPTSAQGVTPPLTPPFTLGAGQTVSASLLVGGVVSTWPSITIVGPISYPVVKLLGGWELRLNRVVLSGQSVTLDCRPQSRSVLSSTGASWVGDLNRAYSRLSQAVLAPGAASLSLSGTDPTGTSYMMIRWQPGYATMV